MSEFQNVIAHPHSLQARRALADHWLQTGDPRGKFASDQIDVYEGRALYTGEQTKIELKIIRAIEKHGREWAGELVEFFTDFEFELGLVSSVAVSVDTFVNRGMELIRTAPIVDVTLWPPGDPTKVADIPALAQMRSLAFGGGPWITDDVVERLAASSYLGQLRALDVGYGNVTARGVTALAQLERLPHIMYIDITGNPCVNTLTSALVAKVKGRTYLVGEAGRASLESAISIAQQGYASPDDVLWPPSFPEFSFDKDA